MDEISEYGSWVNELDGYIRDEDRFINKDGVLPIVASLQELTSWLTDPRQYSKLHRDAWQSVVNDCEHSINSLGPSLNKLLRRRANNLLTSLRQLPLQSQSQMRAPASVLMRKKALRQSRAILRLIQGEDSLILAWNDLVLVTQNELSSPSRIRVLRDIMIDIAHHQNRNMGSFGLRRNISELLRSSVDNLEYNMIFRDAGLYESTTKKLTIEDRLKLCELALLQEEENRDRVVWLEISRASMHKMRMDCGDVTLFNGQWLMGQKELANKRNIRDLPIEFQTNLERFGNHMFSGKKHTILARIALKDGHISAANEEARAILQGLFDIGGVAKGNDWAFDDSYVVYSDNKDVMSSTSRNREIEEMYNPHVDSVSEQIEHYEITTSKVDTSALDERLDHLVELVGELRAASNQSNEAKLLASTRLLEHITSWCDDGAKWYKFADQFIKRSWSRGRALAQLDTLVAPVFFTSIRIQGKEHEGLQRLREKDIVNMRSTGYTLNRGKAINNLRSILKLNKVTKHGRSFDWLVRMFSDGVSLHASLVKLDKQFERELARLVRYRNALEHGGPRHNLVADSSADFAAQIAHLSASIAMDSFLSGKDPKRAFDRNSKVLNRKFRQLASGGRAVRILGNR